MGQEKNLTILKELEQSHHYQTALKIIKKLRNKGYQAYLAGGCVRDILIGKKPQDYDIVTSAKPEEIEAILKKTIPVGKKFGVILAVEEGHHFEIATFRSDAGYSDGRRPDAIYFTNAQDDAKRRDFTINGLFFDPFSKKVVDYVGGQEDLKRKILRFIGSPEERIKEDNLRILRAIRFKNSLGLKYDSQTFKALQKNAYLIWNISAERLQDELNKILKDKNRFDALKDMEEIGLLKYLFPEIERLKGVLQPDLYHPEGDVFQHTLLALKHLPPKAPLFLIWATLFHDLGKPDTFKVTDRIRFDGHAKRSLELAGEICQRLRMPKKEQQMIGWLVEYHMILSDLPKMRRAKQLKWLLDPRFKYLLALFKADVLGSVKDPKKADLSLYNQIKKLYQEAKKLPRPKKPILTGKDIIKYLKIPQGPQIGKLLKLVEEAHLEGKIKTKKQAIKYLKNQRKINPDCK